MYSKEITEKFLEKYKEFETIRDNDFKRFNYYNKKEPDLFELFRNIRNNLAHNSVDGEYPYIVSEDVLKSITNLVDSMQEKLIERAIHFNHLYYATYKSKIIDVINEMNKNDFQYIPVIEDGKIRSVFSSNVLLNYICEHKTIDEKLTMSDLRDYFGKEVFKFYPKSTFTYEVIDLFHRRFNNKRLVVIFITENGRNDESILGMITSYEV